MRQHPKETQYVIQYLRAVAAALVVFHHTAYEVIGAISGDFFFKSEPGLVLVGAGGVDIFFVISGFIIFYTMTTQTGPSVAATFVRNRFVRVVPLYWFWTSILAAAMSTGLVLKNTPISPSMVASSFALIPYEKLPGNFHPVLDQGWTLSFEMYFYLVVAILISFVPYRLRLLAVILILTLVRVLATVVDLPPNLLFLFGSPLVYEFCAGAAIAYYGVPWSRSLSRQAKQRVGVGMLLLGALTFAASAFFTEVREFRLLYWGAPSVLMVAGAVLANRAPSHSLSKLAFWFGTASYSLYLTHGFLTILLGAVLKRGVLQWIAPDLLTILAACVIIVLGSLTYLVVEKPLLNVFRRKNSPPYETASSSVSTRV